jgi:hypothetical protein
MFSQMHKMPGAEGFEVLPTVVAMTISAFSDLTSCSPLKVNRNFERTFRLYLKGRKISQTRIRTEAVSEQSLESVGCAGLGKNREDVAKVWWAENREL